MFSLYFSVKCDVAIGHDRMARGTILRAAVVPVMSVYDNSERATTSMCKNDGTDLGTDAESMVGVSCIENWRESRQVPGTSARELHVAGFEAGVWDVGMHRLGVMRRRRQKWWSWTGVPYFPLINEPLEHEPYTITGGTRTTQGIITTQHPSRDSAAESWDMRHGAWGPQIFCDGSCSGVRLEGVLPSLPLYRNNGTLLRP